MKQTAAPQQIRIEYIRLPDRRYVFEMALLRTSDSVIIARAALEPREPIIACGETLVAGGDLATWFLFKGKRYDIARVCTPDGRFKGFYVDALDPVIWDGHDPLTLRPLTDLFLDLWIWPDTRHMVLDQDELADAELNSTISAMQADSARETIRTLTEQIAAGTFPPRFVLEYRDAGQTSYGHASG